LQLYFVEFFLWVVSFQDCRGRFCAGREREDMDV